MRAGRQFGQSEMVNAQSSFGLDEDHITKRIFVITSRGEAMGHLSSFSRPVAIVILPLLGFFFERDLDEPISGLFEPALYSLYVVGVLAFAALFVGRERLSPVASSIAAGTFLLGTVIVGLIAAFGTGA